MTVRVIVPVCEHSLRWVGPEMLLNHLVQKISEIREVNEVVLMADSDTTYCSMKDEVYAELFSEEALSLDWNNATPKNLLRMAWWYAYEHLPAHAQPVGWDALDTMVMLSPLYPFVERGKLEQVIQLAMERQYAFTAAEQSVLQAQTVLSYTVQPATVWVDAALALKPGVLQSGTNGEVSLNSPTGKKWLPEPVLVDPFEALRVDSEPTWRIAEAMSLSVDNG